MERVGKGKEKGSLEEVDGKVFIRHNTEQFKGRRSYEEISDKGD